MNSKALKQTPSGTDGWDSYAPFYDWENAQTVARRDIAFWQRLALAGSNERPVLELGCALWALGLLVCGARYAFALPWPRAAAACVLPATLAGLAVWIDRFQ